MLKFLKNWFDFRDDEIRLFIWSFVLLFLIRSSGIIFNNFAETAFLKRYGVEYLPFVYMANAVITFIIMGLLAGLMRRLGGTRLLIYVLFFCGVSVAALRPAIYLGIDLLYPLLFILKAQYEILLGLLFWNLANDLFNIRQSKRLFPLIIAGGVIGEIIGSFCTPILGAAISIDNLMLVYAFTTMLSVITVKKMRSDFPRILISGQKVNKKASRPSVIRQVQDIRSLIKETPLVTILVVLTLIPNIAIPILNYQFNYAINSQFATEAGMIQFFGYFRGVMNIISLVILLFVGKAYGRLGLPVALMFHPVNYIFVFMAFLFRFDIFSAIYARLSTNIIRTTMNKPVTDVLMGIFPAFYRSKIRPFLRGTVVRIALFAGSGLILITEGWLHPKYLSLAILPFVGIWIATIFYLKKNYSKILSGLLSKDMMDMRSMEGNDVKDLFKDNENRKVLINTFLSARGADSLWYARLLKSLAVENLDDHILSVMEGQDDKTKIGLLELISNEAGDDTVRKVEEMADIEKRDLFIATIHTLKRIHTDACTIISKEMMEKYQYPEVRAYTASCLYGGEPDTFRKIIVSWLNSKDKGEQKAGVIAAGESKDKFHIHRLEALLLSAESSKLIPTVINSLHLLEREEMNNLVIPYLSHNEELVRMASLDAMRINDDQTLQHVIPLLADQSDLVRERAKIKIQTASYQNGKLLIESLKLPNKTTRDSIFGLLEILGIKEPDTFLFAQNQIEKSYVNLVIIEALTTFQGTVGRDLLKEHLEQKTHEHIESLFRVLAIQDKSGQIQTVLRSLYSKNERQKANALEVLEAILEQSLLHLVMPLLDGTSLSKALEIGRKKISLPNFGPELDELFMVLLEGDCWVSVVHVLYCIREDSSVLIDPEIINRLTKSKNPAIQKEAKLVLHFQQNQSREGKYMESEMLIADKILHLKKIDIFKQLSVNELAAIASITKKKVYSPGEIIFKERDIAETMYLVIEGEVTTLKNEKEFVGKLVAGENFGTMALLLDEVRLLTARTETQSQLLIIHKQEFKEIVREYPQIAMEISKELARHIQRLLEKVTSKECTAGDSVFT